MAGGLDLDGVKVPSNPDRSMIIPNFILCLISGKNLIRNHNYITLQMAPTYNMIYLNAVWKTVPIPGIPFTSLFFVNGWKQVISTGTDHKQLLLNNRLTAEGFPILAKSLSWLAAAQMAIVYFFLLNFGEKIFSFQFTRVRKYIHIYVWVYVYAIYIHQTCKTVLGMHSFRRTKHSRPNWPVGWLLRNWKSRNEKKIKVNIYKIIRKSDNCNHDLAVIQNS